MKLRFWITLLFMLFSVQSLGQECDPARKTTDKSRFDVNVDGTITDIVSGLTWMRCAIGQNWNGKSCEGEAKRLSWGQAKAIAISASTNKSIDPESLWRLPKLNELAGIVDISCYSPRIDLKLFPNTMPERFWTNNSAPGEAQRAFTLSFGKEGVSRNEKSEQHYVRLVRGRE